MDAQYETRTIQLAAGTGVMVDCIGFDRLSVEVEWGNGGTSATLAVRLAYGNRPARSVDFGSAVTLDSTTVRAAALDVQAAPGVEIIVTTAAATETAILHLYKYATR